MNPRPYLIALALSTATLTACSTPKEELVGKPPAEDPTAATAESALRPQRIKLQRDTKEPEKIMPDPLFSAELWPFIERLKTFSVHWNAPPSPLPIHERPDPNSPMLGEAIYQRGEEIIWRGTWMGVYTPSAYTARRSVVMEGTLWTPDAYLTGDEHVSTKIGPGTQIGMLHYAGDGMCYMLVQGKIIHGLCPTEADFRGHFAGALPSQDFQPAERIWWVRIVTPQVDGWIPLDHRVALDILDQ